ncbi:MAG: hypothetical protein ACAH82_03350 [Solirubrobacteraceae bacterium]
MSSPAARLLALQRTAGNGAVGRLLQRQVRVDGGRRRVDEAHFMTGAGKTVGTRFSVAGLIADPVRRVFADRVELEEYANGKTDHIGDVRTSGGDTFWYRLPKDKLTVLGEEHDNPKGNVEDVILAFGTSRFMYEAINELAPTKALGIPYTGTQARLDQINKGIRIGSMIDRARFAPDLENIVVKALTGTSIMRNEYIAGSDAVRNDPQWKARPNANSYSFGERVALYLSMAIHIAADVAQHNFGTPNFVESLYVSAGRELATRYRQHQAVLDTLMKAKDGDELIGIFELTQAGGFANLPAIKEFTLAFHEFGTRYIAQLGSESGNADLEARADALRANPGATLDTLSPIREAIMWGKILSAKGYLLIGMGDAHRVNLIPKLDKAGIRHEKVDEGLRRQRTAIDATWVK